MSKFGDPGFQIHATNARLAAALVLRIANADVLPYDYVEFARTMSRFVIDAQKAIQEKRMTVSVSSLQDAISRMESAATAFNAARDGALHAGLNEETARRVNATLLGVERALTRPQGLVTRPWFRNLVYAADENNGYSTTVFPSVNEAVRSGNEHTVVSEVADLAKRFDAATTVLNAATALLKSR
jgi:N-acetylated-alpha-linked acidic dipeptidase